MENKEQPAYYAIIPADVRYDERLTANAKLLYGEITALCNDKGYCWATNEYFANLYKVSKVSISGWIKNLADCGYVNIELDTHNKENVKRYLSILTGGIKENFKGYTKKLNGGIKENFNTGIKENLKYNNTSINNTVNKADYAALVNEFFNNEPVKTAINTWLDYKKENRQTYKPTGLKVLLERLKKDADNFGEQYVIDEINHSIGNRYAGIYAEKNYQKPKKQEFQRHNYSDTALSDVETPLEAF